MHINLHSTEEKSEPQCLHTESDYNDDRNESVIQISYFGLSRNIPHNLKIQEILNDYKVCIKVETKQKFIYTLRHM